MKLAATLIVVGLVPSIALEFNANKLIDSSYSQINAGAISTAAEIMDKVDRNLFERYGDVQAFVNNSVVYDQTQWGKRGSSENRIAEAMNNYVTGYGMYYITKLVDTKGNLIAVNDIDRAGKPIDTTSLYQQNYANEKWFKDAIEGKFLTADGKLSGTVVEDAYVDSEVAKIYGDEGLSIGFTAPVKNKDGEIIAVWKNTARFDLVEQVLADSYQLQKDLGIESFRFVLLDQNGTLIADYDPFRS
jgi:methyl-accepting chemotaxis protein